MGGAFCSNGDEEGSGQGDFFRFAATEKIRGKDGQFRKAIDFLHGINDHKCMNHPATTADSTVYQQFIEISK